MSLFNSSCPQVVFVGHPHTTIGKGQELRSNMAAYKFLDGDCGVYDIFRYATSDDKDHHAACGDSETATLGDGIRIFHINGDEVERVISVLNHRGQDFKKGYNVIVPAWELPRYPDAWVGALRHFNEVWAISRFVEESLRQANVESHYVGQSVELPHRPLLPRRSFGIRDSSFVFLTFVDLTSYAARKNPQAAIEIYCRLRRIHPYEDMQLVVKVKDGDHDASEAAKSLLVELSSDIIFLDKPLTGHETHSLLAACDCFISLHRSEGFGRVAGEAMWLGRTALATGWSGNLDYMDGHPCAVDYSLVPVEEGQYPHHQGQVWAEPDLDQASAIAERLIADHTFWSTARRCGELAVKRNCSHRAVGLRIDARICAIAGGR